MRRKKYNTYLTNNKFEKSVPKKFFKMFKPWVNFFKTDPGSQSRQKKVHTVLPKVLLPTFDSEQSLSTAWDLLHGAFLPLRSGRKTTTT